jgi:protein SCO1/2
MSFKLTHVMMLIVLADLAGCGPGRSGKAPPPVAPRLPRDLHQKVAPDPATTDYTLKGVVKKVEKELEHVTIWHDAIPGFMDAMTMRFALRNRNVLEKLRPGDFVQGTLRVERAGGVVHDYALLGLTVVKPAPPRMVTDISKNSAPVREESRRLEIGDPVPDFTMTGQDGKSVKLTDFRRNVVVLTFIYTRCPLPDFCPLMDKRFSELAQRIGAFPGRAKQIRLISLSFDPEHDTPEVLRKHAQLRGAAPPLWSFAVASHAELAKIAAPLGLFYQAGGGEVAHNLCTAVVDPRGKLARLEIGTERNKWESADMQKTVYALLPAAPE